MTKVAIFVGLPVALALAVGFVAFFSMQTSAQAADPSIQEFLCYTNFESSRINEAVMLQDQFDVDPVGATVLSSPRFCNPVASSSGRRLTLYQINHPSIPPRTVVVGNRFDPPIRLPQALADNICGCIKPWVSSRLHGQARPAGNWWKSLPHQTASSVTALAAWKLTYPLVCKTNLDEARRRCMVPVCFVTPCLKSREARSRRSSTPRTIWFATTSQWNQRTLMYGSSATSLRTGRSS